MRVMPSLMRAQMSQELFLVNGCHGIDRFDLHHYLVLDDQVCAESHLDPDLLIDNRDRWLPHRVQDRKSTRLNSSHGYISYAVFCLKKKNNDYLTAFN